MNVAHLHLLLNHLPTLGFALALTTYVVALGARSDDLRRYSLALIFLVSLLAFPTYETGYAARLAIQDRADYAEAAIDAHQGAALLALIVIGITGIVAWVGLWQWRRFSCPAPWVYPVVSLLSLATVALMARAANFGGEISHPEIRPGAEVAQPVLLSYSILRVYNDQYPRIWPFAEVLHFVGLSVLFGVVLLINLRILGALRAAAFADLHRLLPWGVAGFALNGFSGMYFVAVQPEQYAQSTAFLVKLLFMVLAGAQVLYFTLFEAPWTLKAGEEASPMAKLMAATQIGLWGGALYLGRMLPYIGGSLTQ